MIMSTVGGQGCVETPVCASDYVITLYTRRPLPFPPREKMVNKPGALVLLNQHLLILPTYNDPTSQISLST